MQIVCAQLRICTCAHTAVWLCPSGSELQLELYEPLRTHGCVRLSTIAHVVFARVHVCARGPLYRRAFARMYMRVHMCPHTAVTVARWCFFRMCACMFARVRIRALECRRESLCIGPWYTDVWAYARARKPTYERARSCVHARGKESVLVCKCVRARVRAHDARPCCVNIDTLRCVCSRFRIVYVCVRARASLCTRAFAFEYT